jgi:hypothetical protein
MGPNERLNMSRFVCLDAKQKNNKKRAKGFIRDLLAICDAEQIAARSPCPLGQSGLDLDTLLLPNETNAFLCHGYVRVKMKTGKKKGLIRSEP